MAEDQEVRFITSKECALKLRITIDRVFALIKIGKLQAIRTGRSASRRGIRAAWRIVDPGDKFIEYLEQLDHHLEHVPLLSTAEAAVVIGTSKGCVQGLVNTKRLIPARRGSKAVKGSTERSATKLFTIDEIRRFLLKQQKRKYHTHRVEIQRLIEFAKITINESLHGDAQKVQARDELNREIDQMLKLPEPHRRLSLVDLWEKLDKVEYIAGLVKEKQQDPSPGPTA